jgi:uncharacterized damage-inducible protein DinB
MIASMREFTEYFDGVRRRTVSFFRTIPAEMIDWAPKDGEYTCGDIVRHVAASESMFTGVVSDGVWRYDGHARELGATREQALALLDARHATAVKALAASGDAALALLRPALEPGGRPIRGWRVLMAMCEHEVHHRSQLASYLTLMGIDAPDIFGLGVEDVAELATGAPAVSLRPPTAQVDASNAAPAVSLRPPTAQVDATLRYDRRSR